MRGYELCLIFQHETNEDSIDRKIENLREKTASSSGEIIKIEKWGKRSLKYTIKKQQKGYYCFVTLTGDNKTLNEIERLFKYDESVLRYSYIRLEESEIEAIKNTPEPEVASKTTPAAVKEQKKEPEETAAPAETKESTEATDIEI